MREARPPDYLECETLFIVRRRVLLAWLVVLFAVLMGVVTYELWQVMVAVMTVHILTGGH